MGVNAIQKIAVAIDFVDEAEDILRFAGELGRCLSAELHLVHVYQPDPDRVRNALVYSIMVPEETEAEHEEVLQEELRQLRGQCDRLRQAGAKTFGYMKPVEKEVAGSVLSFAEEIGADLIIVGTRRPDRIDALLVGSVAKRVLKKSRIPILLVPRTQLREEATGS